jgi:hypothetical protein
MQDQYGKENLEKMDSKEFYALFRTFQGNKAL